MHILRNINYFLKNKINLLGLFLTFFIVFKYYSNTLFSETYIPKISMAVTILLAFILILISIEKYNIYHLLLFIFFTVQFLISKNITLVYCYTLALGLMNLDFNKIIKVYLISTMVFFLIFIFLNLLGIRPSVFINGRNDFGFGNPNGAFVTTFLIWISYLYLKFDTLNIKDLAFLCVFPILVYIQTKTRTGILTIIATIIIFCILRKIDLRERIFKLIAIFTPGILFFISMIITYLFNDNYKLNRILSDRPKYWYSYLGNSNVGLNLTGYTSDMRDIVFNPRLPLDSGYIWGIYSSGIIAFLLLMAVYTYSIYILCNKNKKSEVMMIVAIFIYAFGESILLDLGSNITFVFIAYSLYALDKNIKYI